MAARVILADDNYIVRRGLASVIESEPELELVATCKDLDSLLEAVATTNADVVLTDIRMPPDNTDEGIRAADWIRAHHPDVGVVVLSQYLEPDYALALFKHGTDRRAYVLKENIYDPKRLLTAIREVASGRSLIDPQVTEALVEQRLHTDRSPVASLTKREQEVLSEMAQGKHNQAIANSLFLSLRAIERHVHAIFSKLGLTHDEDVHRRVKAVLMFLGEERSAGR